MQKRALIISFTSITDEPRVLRQVQALTAAGWDIVLAGYKGRAEKPANCELIELRRDYMPSTKIGKYARYAFYIPFIALGRFGTVFSNLAYWINPATRANYEFLETAVQKNPVLKPTIIIAHDYYTAPLAYRLSQKISCTYSVDIHEYAKEQHNHSRIWRLVYKPWIDKIQSFYLTHSSYNSTVCDGIADALEKDYSPMPRPSVLRSVPFYREMPFRMTGDKITVLYHGIIYPNRGLERAIESLPLWRPEFSLLIRGGGNDAYIDELKEKAELLGVGDRLSFEPPVLFNEIIPAANRADIGYFVQDGYSIQKRFTLPNKIFEYISAGLALCVSDLPEMARITKHYDLGKLVSDYDARAIAETINSFDRAAIDAYKQKNLAAAKELCWEKESHTMIKSYEQMAERTTTGLK